MGRGREAVLDVVRALEGNTTMLIWMGKQLLGQKNHPEPSEPLPRDDREVFITVEEFERLMDEAEAEVLEAEREVEKDGAAARPEPAGSGQPGSEGRSASRPNGKSMRESP